MKEILESDIELHHAYSKETDDGHIRRKPFRPLSQPDLIQWMGSFDASLIAYNTNACARNDRFSMSVPDRLISSVAAGVPIAIPAQGYGAMKSYLKDYPATIEFDSPQSLATALADRPRISALRKLAWKTRRAYSAECHGSALQQFLEKLL